MRKYPFHLMLLAGLLCNAVILPALAQRHIAFEELSPATKGSVVVTVAEGLPETGSFHSIDTATGGAAQKDCRRAGLYRQGRYTVAAQRIFWV